MKNILFATTALVATASFASAEVTGSGPGTIDITGWAEMGIIGGEFDGDEMETQFHTDIDVNFSMSGTADNGLTFGASIDLDESDGAGRSGALAFGGCVITDNDDTDQAMTINGETVDFGNVVNGVTEGGAFSDGDNVNAECIIPAFALGAVNGDALAFDVTRQGGETIFVSAGGATLTMGDTDGAFDSVMQEVLMAGGSINDDEEHAGYSGNIGFDGTYDGQIARFDYAFDGFTGSLSVEIDDSGDFDPVWGVGVRYSGDLGGVDLGVGLGYQAVEDNSLVGISVDTTLASGFSAAINYTAFDFDGTEATHGAIGLGYEMNALAVGVNYGHFTFDGDETVSGFGLAASYDLGGGLEAQLGYGNSTFHDFAGGDDVTGSTFSLGLAMSF